MLIAQCVTNEKGEFTFDFQEGLPAPASGTFIFEITIPQQPGQNIMRQLDYARDNRLRLWF